MDHPDKQFAEEPVSFDLEEARVLDARERQAMADIEAGRFISNDAVMRWVKSWGTDNPLPPPECGD